MEPLTPGEVFRNRYLVQHMLGQGGFAAVFAAEDMTIGRRVAIKVLTSGSHHNSAARFMREARVIASLTSPHTIRLFDFGKTESGTLYMVFEHVEGVDLRTMIARHGAQPPVVVQHVLQQLLSALAEAHTAGVLHRDIKPANVLVFEHLGDPWCIKLIDFGIAKATESNGRNATKLTQDGALLGTPRYMPPEAVFGDELRPCSDLYSLGLVMFELLTGRPAVEGRDTEEVMRGVLAERAFELPVTGTVLDTVLPWMLQRQPDARPQAAAPVMVALHGPRPVPRPHTAHDRVRGAEATLVEEPAPTVQQDRPVSRGDRRAWAAVACAAVGVVAVGVAAVAFGTCETGNDDPAPKKVALRENPFGEVEGAVEPEVQLEPEVQAEQPDAAGTMRDAAGTGCGREVRSGLQAHGRNRTWTTYVPKGYDPTRPHRVLLLAHNAMRDGRGMIHGTNAIAFADAHDLVLIAPDSTGATAWAREGDLEFVKYVLEVTREDLCIDPRWIYAFGHGGGGGFLLEARCDLQLSAVATSSAGEHVGFTTCEAEPAPLMRIFGRAGRHVPTAGGHGCISGPPFKSVAQIERESLELNRTPTGPTQWFHGAEGECQQWTGESVTVMCLATGGHDWPGLKMPIEMPGCNAPPLDLPLDRTVWRFLLEYGVERSAL